MARKRKRRPQSRSDLSRLVRLLVVAVLVLVPATAAGAKSFWLTNADVDVVINEDGSLTVTEQITFDFSGSFTGAYRDIKLGRGQTVTHLAVSDGTIDYSPGACAVLGCSSPPGTFGVAELSDAVRVVWHHSSTDQVRTFTISYVMTGLSVAYDDVVDVNLQVWGDGWAVGLDDLTARMHVPGTPAQGEVRVWGHPIGVNGSSTLGDDGTSPALQARNIPLRPGSS